MRKIRRWNGELYECFVCGMVCFSEESRVIHIKEKHNDVCFYLYHINEHFSKLCVRKDSNPNPDIQRQRLELKRKLINSEVQYDPYRESIYQDSYCDIKDYYDDEVFLFNYLIKNYFKYTEDPLVNFKILKEDPKKYLRFLYYSAFITNSQLNELKGLCLYFYYKPHRELDNIISLSTSSLYVFYPDLDEYFDEWSKEIEEKKTMS